MRQRMGTVGAIVLGSAIYSLGFALFLEPHQINAGGVSALAQLAVRLTGVGSVGTGVILLNLPLFLLGWRQIGRRFFLRSLLGMLTSALLLDVFSQCFRVSTEPLMGALFGGVLCGVGLGTVFCAGGSTGGTDICGAILRKRLRSASMGTLMLCIDLGIVALTALAFRNFEKALYSTLSLYLSSLAIDSVQFRFDDSRLALIISDQYEAVAKAVDERIHRGVTMLYAQGYYLRKDKLVLLCALRRQQLAELQAAVLSADPDAFLILQQARQVLGDGFRSMEAEPKKEKRRK